MLVIRPEPMAQIKTAFTGDTVMAHSMDRLARNLIDLKKIVMDLVANGAQVQFLKENLTFSGKAAPYSELMLNMMGSFAEFERSLIRARQSEGIAIRKAAGGYKGKVRLREATPEQVTEIRAMVAVVGKRSRRLPRIWR